MAESAEGENACTGPEDEDSSVLNRLREYEKPEALLSKIPLKAQSKFFMTCDLVLTCIDADSSYIVLGANVGLIFVFSREDNSIQRIKVTGPNNVITSVKIHSGADHFVAAGTSVGHFSIYCFPARTSTLSKKEIKKFELHHVHKYYITCLEWSQNGMKVCTGDTKGQVAVTHVDFYEDKCSSVVLLIDAGNEIVQLSYDHKVLAVSTTQKSYIVRLDQNDKITNISSEDHTLGGKFGACFIPGVCKTDDALLYLAKSDCTLCLSDMKGNVINAQTFHVSQRPHTADILLLAGETSGSKPTEVFQFGKLKMFGEQEVVTWSNSALVVVEPRANRIVAYQDKFNCIVDLAVVNGGEIFVLQRHAGARVIRLAYQPDPKLGKTNETPELVVPPSVVASKTGEQTADISGKAALNFLKKSLAQPLKKLDNLIVQDHERMISTNSEIPSAKIMSESIPDVKIASDTQESPADVSGLNEEEASEAGQSRDVFENVTQDRGTDDGAIIFSRKGKKQKKKHKKGNHGVKIQEDKKEDAHGDGEDASALEALKRADSLLERLTAGEGIHHHQREVTASPKNGLNFANSDFEKDSDGPSCVSETFQERASGEIVICDVVNSCEDESNKESGGGGGCSASDAVFSDATHKRLSEDSHGAAGVGMKNSPASSGILSTNSHVLVGIKNVSDDDMHEASVYNISPSDETFSSSNNLNECVEKALNSLDHEIGSDPTEDEIEADPIEGQSNGFHIAPLHRGLSTKSDVPSEDLYAGSFFKSDSSFGEETHSDSEPSAPSEPSAQGQILETAVRYQVRNIAPKRNANVWSELKAPSNIYSVSISNWHLWYTDGNEYIYYQSLTEVSGTTWRKASGRAQQISVSPSGQIVWCLHKKVILAGTKISARHPEGLKWVEDAKNVEYISVDDSCAWYITEAGSVMVETNLSPQHPLSRPKKISCPFKLKHIVCRYGVVWGITERLQLLVRRGLALDCPEGKQWELQPRQEAPYMFTHVSIGDDLVGWAVDILGQVWFCTGVCRDRPTGCGKWWQVPVSECLVLDNATRQLIKEVAHNFDPVKFSHMVSTVRGGFIVVGADGIYVSLDFNNVFDVCKGNIEGYQWTDGHPTHPKLSSTNVWKLICANVSDTERGFVWAQNVRQNLLAFKNPGEYGLLIDKCRDLTSISANLDTVWGSTSDGGIVAREGIDNATPEGLGWQQLDLVQLGDVHIVYVGCSSNYVWAVDSDGSVFHRIGARAVGPEELSPIWLGIDCYSEIVFTKIYAGFQDWMVWAIDNRRFIYARGGVTDNLPIGREWMLVTGMQAMDIAVSDTGAWILSTSGEIFYRQNVTRRNVCGSEWKKIPGLFTRLSASAEDGLWGITLDGGLQQCNIQNIFKLSNAEDLEDRPVRRSSSAVSASKEESEWILV